MRRALAMLTLVAAFAANRGAFANPIDIYSPEWALKTSGTGYVNTGNVERVLLRGDAAFSYHNLTSALSTATSYIWGTYSGNRAENDWSNRNFLYAFPEAKVYPFVMHWLETGYRRKIDMRNQAGVGGTWAILSSPDIILKLSLMLSGEATDYSAPAYLPDDLQQTTERPLLRATPRVYFRQNLGSDGKALVSELWYQQALKTQNDYRWHWETGIEWALGKTLSLKTLCVYHFESAVPQRVVRQDLAWTFGVTAKWAAEKKEIQIQETNKENQK